MFQLIKPPRYLALVCLVFFAMAQNAISSDEQVYKPDSWFKEFVEASKKGEAELCAEGKFFRKSSGSACRDFTKGVLAVFSCGNYAGFLESQCGKNIKFQSSDKTLNQLVTNPNVKKEDYNKEAYAIVKRALMTPVEEAKGKVYFSNTKWLFCVSDAKKESIQALGILRNDMEVRQKCDEFKNYMQAAASQKAPAQAVIPQKSVYNVLSLDGGGLRGIGTLVILAKLQEAGINVHESFDMFIGTSTGGIIAIMLAEGWKPTDILDFYIDNGPVIFQQNVSKKFRSVGGLIGTKYSKDQLEVLAKNIVAEKNITEAKKPVGVTAYNATKEEQKIISSFGKDETSKDFSLQDAMRATGAAPTYFKGKEVAGNLWVDGGVGANDPSTSAYLEAKKLFPVGAKIRVVSIGTGTSNEAAVSRDSGLKDIKTIIGTLMKASEAANREMIAKIAATDPNLDYRRIQFTLPKNIDLADARKESVDIMMKAAFERTQQADFRDIRDTLIAEKSGGKTN